MKLRAGQQGQVSASIKEEEVGVGLKGQTVKGASEWALTREEFLLDEEGKVIKPVGDTTGDQHQQQQKVGGGSKLFGFPTRILASLQDKLSVAFLPKGYPHTVTKEYLPYSIWYFLHSVTGTVTFTLSTQALLQALGMGAGTAIGIAATTNWIIKDGFGLLGGVIYAGLVNNRFDSHPKRYRFSAAIAIQVSTLAELLTPLFPSFFLPMASLSNVGKNVGWLAHSATRAAMNKGFTLEDNLGDVTAKSAAQSTAAGLIGTGLGVVVSWIFGASAAPTTLLTVFIPISLANLWFAYETNMCVVTRTLNVERGELLFNDFARRIVAPSASSKAAPVPFESSLLPTPEQVAAKESFMRKYRSPFSVPLLVEPPVAKYLPNMTPEEARDFLSDNLFVTTTGDGRDQIQKTERYRIAVVRNTSTPTSKVSSILPIPSLSSSSSGPSPTSPYVVCLWFLEDVKSEEITKAFLHAAL
ncbi:hypothetical protein HK102_005030, partial [Quaeritorhiza haematococci]